MSTSKVDGSLRIAVLSDIHAFADSNRSRNSLVDFTGSIGGARNPLTELIQKVTDLQITADLLVCPGDICNLADISGFQRAWVELKRLQQALKADSLVATCGNHDLDSRHLREHDDDPDPKGALQELSPSFPFDSEALNNHYWAQNFAVLTPMPDVLVLVLNTSAYHGGLQNEIDHGRISRRTIRAISAKISEIGLRPVNILVCHHHLMPMRGEGVQSDSQYVKKGQELLDEISSNTTKSWLVIHGHRHHPRLLYASSTGSNNPIVLGASSLGAQLVGVPNQFHLIDLQVSNDVEHASIVGKVKTWSWTQSSPWVEFINGGLPGLCGFGFKGQIANLASVLATLVLSGPRSWADARLETPSIDYLTPDDFERLQKELRLMGISILFGHDREPKQIGR